MSPPGERHDPYEPFDPVFLRRLVEEAVAPLLDHWFRVELIGAERLPENGPALLAANHSGSAFPFDGMAFGAAMTRLRGYRPERKLRAVFERELAATWWMRPFGIDNFWRRAGGVDLTFDNFDALLKRGEQVLYFPEGVPGIGKGFARRYQLQRFSTSFVIHAARNRVPVYPVYIVNAEWVNPFNFTIPWLDRVMDRAFGVPFLPLPSALVGIAFPWVWYLALPVRMVFAFGEPIDMAARVRDAGLVRLDRSEREGLQRVAESVRREMQQELDLLVERHGRAPYQLRSLLRELWRARRRLHRVVPPGWPLSFLRHARDLERPPARGRLHALLRDWDVIGFWLPFGWPLLSLTRALRRPPYGYRGLTREERREREGSFVWHLADRPLPEER